jgi:peroxiredoxin
LALERDRDELLDLRVVPAAVLDRSAAGTARLARRLDLHFTLIPDSRNIIAQQFSALDPATRRARPAWFVVDRSGRVRGFDRTGVPEGGYPRLVSSTLALAAPGATLPGSTR